MATLNQYENEAIEEEESVTPEPTRKDSHNHMNSRQESVPRLFAAIHNGDIEEVLELVAEAAGYLNCSAYGGLTPLHAACHWKQLDILKLLISRGGKVESIDSLGNTVLHSAVSENWYDGIRELLQHGASPDVMNQPPSAVHGMLKETPLHTAVRTGDLTSTTLLLNHNPNLTIRNSEQRSVFHVAASTRNIQILKLLLSATSNTRNLEDLAKDGNSLYHSALLGEVSVQDETQIIRVFKTVQKFCEDMNQVNLHGETPLILACRAGLPNVVQYLLSHGADPTHVTRGGESTLHAACSAGCSVTLRCLLSTGRVSHLISSIDSEGHHPFFRAVKSSSVDCCKILLENGEHLTHIGRDGISNCMLLIENLPSAMQVFRHLFDAGIKVSKKPQYDPGFSITFDYSVLMSKKEKIQSSIISELADSPVEPLIKHPLLESFLYIKWCRIRRVFYFNFIQFFVYVLMHTAFIMTSFGATAIEWSQYPSTLLTLKILHGILLVFILVPGAITTIANFKKYIRQWETYTRLTAVVTSAIVIFMASSQQSNLSTSNSPSFNTTKLDSNEEARPPLGVERGLASTSVFFCWIELMMLLGRFPFLGAYVLMFTKVAKSVIKFTLSFLSLLIGFSLSFHILFQQMPVFADFKISFAKTLMMMTGEIAYSEFVGAKKMPLGVYSLTVMSMFLFMVTVIMSNLLIGLAVNDIPDLKRQGKINRLVKEASYLTAYEKLIVFAYNSKYLPRKVLSLLSSRCHIHTVLTVFPNKEVKRYKYNQTIPDGTIREAITLGSCEDPEDFVTDAEEDVNQQLKAFQIRYSGDRRTQRHKLTSLSETCTEIKKEVEQQQVKIESQLAHLSMQLQQQIQQNQNLFNQLSHMMAKK